MFSYSNQIADYQCNPGNLHSRFWLVCAISLSKCWFRATVTGLEERHKENARLHRRYTVRLNRTGPHNDSQFLRRRQRSICISALYNTFARPTYERLWIICDFSTARFDQQKPSLNSNISLRITNERREKTPRNVVKQFR